MSATNTGQQGGVGRRTVAKGAAWAVPAIAVAGAAPAHAASGLTTTTTTLPECVDNIEATGGTYPVIPRLWNCPNPEENPNHWDFRLKFNVTASNCPYCKVQIRLWDNPQRSSLIYTPTSHHTNNRQPYYVDSAEITPTAQGVAVVLPSTGNVVYQTGGASTGVTITGDGSANDSLHALYTGGMAPGDPVACGPDVAMARYSIRYQSCGTTTWGPWEGPFDVDPCIPMISATVCRVDSTNDSITVSVARGCGLSGSDFNLTQVRRSSDGSDPTTGSVKWSTGTTLAAAPVSIVVARSGGSGDFYWVEFNTGDANIKSRVRIARPADSSTTCSGCGPAPTGLSACKLSGDANGNAVHRITWTQSPGLTYEARTSTSTSGTNNWTGWTTQASPYTTPAGSRRVEVRVNGCTEAASISIANNTTWCPPAILSATNNQASCPSGNNARTIDVTWTGGTTKIQYRVADGGGNFSGNWTNLNDSSSPGTISLTGGNKCRAVQVRLCNGGNSQTCDSPSSIVTVPQLA